MAAEAAEILWWESVQEHDNPRDEWCRGFCWLSRCLYHADSFCFTRNNCHLNDKCFYGFKSAHKFVTRQADVWFSDCRCLKCSGILLNNDSIKSSLRPEWPFKCLCHSNEWHFQIRREHSSTIVFYGNKIEKNSEASFVLNIGWLWW